jgi:hypothetical protein
MEKLKEKALYLITWHDSNRAWDQFDWVERLPYARIQSVGFLVRDDTNSITIAQDLIREVSENTPAPNTRALQTILKCCINSIEELGNV